MTEEFLAAFANSHAGGAILVGVEEGRASNGLQSAQVVGCTVGDREKLTLLNRALGCSPPVQIQVIVENLSRCPFLRVEIPSSPHRPHCTSSGKYVIRGDGRNEPLIPERLLRMMLDTQGAQFLDRFRSASAEIEDEIREARSELGETARTIGAVDEALHRRLDMLDEITGGLEILFAETEGGLTRLDEKVDGVDELLGHLNRRVLTLLLHQGLGDPVEEQAAFNLMGVKLALRPDGVEPEATKLEVQEQFSEVPRGRFEELYRQALKIAEDARSMQKLRERQ